MNKRSTPVTSWLVLVFAIVSFIGLLDASYLTAKHYLGGPIPCAILNGCEEVTTSKYSAVLGIPVSLAGAFYYLSVLILSLAYLDSKNYRFIRYAAWLTVLGFSASLWFLFVQFFIIKALCLYCIVSAVSSGVLFVFGLLIMKLDAKHV